MLHGGCHCGAITIELDTAREPEVLPVRTCGCTFCLAHRPRYTSDPSGHVVIRIASEAAISRYRFGLRLADFVICKTCGVFVAAVEAGPPSRAVINSSVLAERDRFVAEPVQFTAYDREDAAQRTARRAANWTPATLIVADNLR